MSLSLLEVLFDAKRHLDARFWLDVRTRLVGEGFGLLFREDGADFNSEHGWKNVADGHYPEPTSHGFLVSDHRANGTSKEARLQVNVFRVWDPHDEPWALPWNPETKELLTLRRARLEVQLLRVGKQSTEFGEAFVKAAAAALDGVMDDESNGSLILPDGAIEPYPTEAEERTPSVFELSHPGTAEDTPTENEIGAASDDPLVPTLRFDLECQEAFTPQHIYDGMSRIVKGLLPFRGFSQVRATTDWELFGFADKDASGLTVYFQRFDGSWNVELTFDLYKTFDPSKERIAKIHKLAHELLETVLAHLDAKARRSVG